jgi:group I intron endonuclease
MKYLYKIINTINGHTYIGFTSRSVSERYSSHKSNAFRQNRKSKLYSAMRKYGVDAFVVETIYEGEDALEKENDFISLYECEYNMTKGGEANQLGRTWNLSEETKKKISSSRKGIEFSTDHKENLSKSHKGQIPWNKGTFQENVSAHALYMREYRKRNKG